MAVPEGYTKLGIVGYSDKGTYNASVTYNKYNTVYYNGSTYIALKDNLRGVTPADGVNWKYMAKGFNEASADGITVMDTSGIIDGTKNKKTILQTFLNKVGDFIVNKAVTNDVLIERLGNYMAKTAIAQTESTATDKVPSSAYLKQVIDTQNSNLELRTIIWSHTHDVYTVANVPQDVFFDTSSVADKTILMRCVSIISTSATVPMVSFVLPWDDIRKVVVVSNTTDTIKIQYGILYK